MPVNSNEEYGISLIYEYTKLSTNIYKDNFSLWSVELFNTLSLLDDADLNKISNIASKYNISRDEINAKDREYISPYISNTLKNFKIKYSSNSKEAMYISATMEELIISDIDILLKETENSDFTNLFNNIKYNCITQLRAINKFLKEEYEIEYKPHYLDSTLYYSIF